MSVKKEKEERSYALKLEGTDEAVKLDKDHQVLLDSMISDKANAIKLFEDHLQKGVEDICQPLTVILELADLDHVDLLKKAFKILYLHDKNDQKRQLLITTMLLLIDEKGTKNQLIRYINSFIQDYPKWDHLYIQRAQYYDDSGKFEKAINDFNMAIKLNPVKTETYGLRADTYTKMKKFNKALEDYDILVSEDPSEYSYFRRFDCYTEKEETYGYLSAHEKQMRSSDIDNAYNINNNPSLLIFRANMKKNEGKPREAISDYETLLRDASIQENIKASILAFPYRMKAECHLDIGELDAAKKDIKKAIDLDDSDSKNYFLRSKIFYQNYENKFSECKEGIDPAEEGKKKLSKKKISVLMNEVKMSIMSAKKDVDKAIGLIQSDEVKKSIMNVNVYYTILCLKHRKKIIEANDNPRKKYKKDLSLKEIKQIEKDLSFIVEYGEKTDDYYDDLVDIVRFYKSGYKKLYKELAPEIAQPNYKEEVALIEENKLLKKKIVVLEKQFKRDFKKNDLIKENNLLKTKIVELSDQQARDLIQFNEVRAADKREVVNNMTQDIYHTLNSDLEGFGNKIEKVVDLVNKNFKKSLKKPYRKKRSWETKDPDTIGQVINTAFDEWKQLEDRTKAMKRVFSVDPNLKSMNNIDKHMKKMLVQPKDSNLTVKCVSKNNISNLKMKIDKELWRIMLGEIISNAKKHNHKKNIDLIFEFDKDKQLNRLTIYYYNTGTPGKVKFLRRRGGLAIIKKIIELHGFSIQPRENDNNFNFEIIIPLKI